MRSVSHVVHIRQPDSARINDALIVFQAALRGSLMRGLGVLDQDGLRLRINPNKFRQRIPSKG